MSALTKWQESIAENLAAAKVPGYKAVQVSFNGERGGQLPIGDGTKPDASNHFVLPTAVSSFRFSEGPFEPTGVSTHLAISGDAFFEVELEGGERVYTRDGEFSLDAEGNLTTKQGFKVIGTSGTILVPDSGGKIDVSPEGEIAVNGKASGQQIHTVEIEDKSQLSAIGGGFFKLEDTNTTVNESETARLLSGHLEGSNVAPMREMTRLIDVVRAYQSNQKIIQSHDERLGRTITELGTPGL